MATPSDPPPSSADKNSTNPLDASAIDGQDSKVDAVKESSPASVFVNSEPIREDQVQNAVKFLSHPKVRGSPVIYRRSFLERKGLAKEEIDEAFRRVPDPTPAVTTTQPVVNSQDGQTKSSSNVQQQPAQVLQPTSLVPASSTTKTGIVSRFHWSHALLAFGFLTVSGAGTALLFKNAIIPRLKSWICKVVLEEEKEEGLLRKGNVKPSVAEEAAAAAKAAAAAASDVARASQEMLATKAEEKRYFEELINMLNVQLREMKSMSYSIQMLESVSGQSINARVTSDERDGQRKTRTSSKQPYANGKADNDSLSVRSLSPPAPVEPSVAPHPKSYMEIMSMIQRGERPSNIREINDAPPNPNQPLSNPRIAPRPKPWEVQAQNSATINGSSYNENQFNGDGALPWLQNKNVRITEIDANSNLFPANERPVQRSWVPPQPPPVVMPEAAEAIRQPKRPAYQKEPMVDEQLLARSTVVSDELQRITKISESGGPTENNGDDSVLYSTGIQKEENGSYMEARISEAASIQVD